MRNLITVTLSIFVLLGLTSPVLAASDTTGENFVPDVDLASASVVTSNQMNPAHPPDVANIGITMAAGSHLPGLIIFDFDVDNDTATGTVGTLAAPLPTAEGGGTGPYKPGCNQGYDFFVVVALRKQSDTSQMGLSDGCFGSAVPCIERGAQCTACAGGAEAYELGDMCASGPNCYNVITSVPTGCAEGTCYQLNDPCPSDQSCAMGLLRGEWYMAIDLLTPPAMRGKKLLPFQYNPNNETNICLTLPWAEMIAEARMAYSKAGKTPFPIDYSVNNPPQYQVSVWYDTPFTDNDDFSDAGGSPINLSDYMPDAGGDCTAAGEFNQYDPCLHNSFGGYGNLNVDANDVGNFLAEFGRSVFSRPCPNCKN